MSFLVAKIIITNDNPVYSKSFLDKSKDLHDKTQCKYSKHKEKRKLGSVGGFTEYGWQVLMLLLVEEPRNHSNAFVGERKREMGLVRPLWRSMQHTKHVTTASAVCQTSCHYLGRPATAGRNTPVGMQIKA